MQTLGSIYHIYRQSEFGTEIGFGWPSGCNQLQLYINIQPSKRNILSLQTYYIVRDLTHDWDVKVKTGLHTTVVDKIMESIVARIFFFWVSDEVSHKPGRATTKDG